MALTYGFFDARQSTGGVYDRVYTAEQMSKYFKGIFTDGVLMNVGQMLAVSASSGMVVQVGTGRAFLDARWMESDTVIDLVVPDAHAILNRKDIIVARLDYSNRLIEIDVKTGTAASTPVAPSVQRDGVYFELELAEISVPAGTTAITQSLITDKRADQSVCGYVTGLITQIDTETFWTQLQDAFGAWFDEMKDQLDEDAAGHLQLEIDDILGDFATHELTDEASRDYKIGEFLIYNRLLYRVTAAIEAGDTIVPDTNVVQTTVAEKVSNNVLFFTSVAVSASASAASDIARINDGRITADHVLTECVWANPSNITSDVSWITSAGALVLNGKSSAATTATITLVKKDN